jgi:hypothetical protein
MSIQHRRRSLTPRTSLKVAFVVAGVSPRAVSMTTDIPKTRLSSIVRGRTEPHPRERAALSAALGRDERDPREKDRSAAIEEVSGRSRRHAVAAGLRRPQSENPSNPGLTLMTNPSGDVPPVSVFSSITPATSRSRAIAPLNRYRRRRSSTSAVNRSGPTSSALSTARPLSALRVSHPGAWRAPSASIRSIRPARPLPQTSHLRFQCDVQA